MKYIIPVYIIQRNYNIILLPDGNRTIEFGNEWKLRGIIKEWFYRMAIKYSKISSIPSFAEKEKVINNWIKENYEKVKRIFELSKVLKNRALEAMLTEEIRTLKFN